MTTFMRKSHAQPRGSEKRIANADRPRPAGWALSAVAALTFASPATAQQWTNPKAGQPPRAKPQRRTGGESLPPLPLPATPLRRTERKRPPAPPALVGMINFTLVARVPQADTPQPMSFPTTQIDIEALMRQANRRLNVQYRYVPTSLETFSWDPTELPLLYVTGWTELPELSDVLLDRLQRYLCDGGTLVVRAQCGRKEFVDSARPWIDAILPGRQLAAVDTDSPLFSAYYQIRQMRFRKDSDPFQATPPYMEAVYLGCRPAIIFSPIDLNCGWDVVSNPIEGGTLYHQEDAARLGVNIIAVTLANQQYARTWGIERRLPQQDEPTRDQLVVGQIVHNGDWDPTPHAIVNMLKYLQHHTTLNVQFKRDLVDLDDDGLFGYPVLMMTGLRDFALTDAQVLRLRQYLRSGGVLVADASAGRAAFDAAFRREIARVLPDDDLQVLPLDSPLYQMPFQVARVDYTELQLVRRPGLDAPTLEGIAIDGQLGVIYSSVGLTNGWERLGYAFNRGYADADALRLGVNIFTYALTH